VKKISLYLKRLLMQQKPRPEKITLRTYKISACFSPQISRVFQCTYANDDQLCKYIEQKNNKTIYKRLGFLIDTMGISAENLKTICKQNISKGYSLLDPRVKVQGVFNSKWNLRINVRIR